ncbi:MAG: hypothetical protein ACK4GL_00080 [Flavobacteriales bacterium]
MIKLTSFWCLTFALSFCLASQAQLLHVEQMPVTVEQRLVKSPADFSASTSIKQDGQSLMIEIIVKDDEWVRNIDHKTNYDRVEIYFAREYTDYVDYIYGETNGMPRLFRQTTEPSSLVDLKSFIENADYPKKAPSKEYPLPTPDKLSRKIIPIGLVGIELPAEENGKAKMLLTDLYHPFEKKVKQAMGNIAQMVNYTFEKLSDGYVIKAKVEKEALGFFSIPETKNFRMMVEVYDADASHVKQVSVASLNKSREALRPFYFQKIKLEQPFVYQLQGVNPKALKSTNISINGFYGQQGVSAFGELVQSIIYDRNVISEADLIEYFFHAESYTSETAQTGEFSFDIITFKAHHQRPFVENERMFIYQGTVQSSKIFAYDRAKTSNMVNMPAVLPNNYPGLVLYDYEPEEHNGWSDCGTCSDEVVSIFSLRDPGNPVQVFTIGAKLRRSGELFLERDTYRNVKDFDVNWDVPGKSFTVDIIFRPESRQKNFRVSYEIDEQLVVKKR